MSGLSMRNRLITVVVSGAIVAPFALMGSSANAASTEDLTSNLPVVGDLGLTDSLLGGGGLPVVGGLPIVGDVLGGGAGANASPLGAVPVAGPVVDGLLGPVLENALGAGVLDTITDLGVLETVLGTVGGVLANVPQILKTVTDLVKNVTGALDLGKLLNGLPVKVNAPEVKGASKAAKSTKSEVKAGALPHTGGNADMTAMLLCAGLAVAGTGVTLVTRRRNALLGA